jgi:hypothetical protein
MVKPYEFGEQISGHHVKERHRIRWPAQQWEKKPEDEPIYTVLAIGDAHDKPGRCKERFKWFGRFAAEHRPHYICSIGDWCSLDSLSTHEQPGSANDAARPAFHEELDSLDESLSLFTAPMNGGNIPIFHTHGNHEFRTWRAANRQPKLNGDMPIRLESIFARYRIQTFPFGETFDLHGIDFVHIPLNIMGKEMGGEHVERTIAAKSMRSTVCGHTHRRNIVHIPKTAQRKITVINLGTSLPHGTIEKYARLSMAGWSYGLFLLRIQGGVILSEKFFDMIEIQDRYA